MWCSNRKLLRQIAARLERIEQQLAIASRKDDAVATDLSALQAAVTRVHDVAQSAVTLIVGLADMLRNAPDMAAIQQMANDLNSTADAMAQAIVAGTPQDQLNNMKENMSQAGTPVGPSAAQVDTTRKSPQPSESAPAPEPLVEDAGTAEQKLTNAPANDPFK